ncbi:glycosyltransferase family 2 protein [Actinoplanes sp. GCM10030250]|uniref:glycosyltransferase family 2 protein n=1 Tax=Actinoplanes sp. GCM10030250 TaxID=3273376 RepID=UPI00362026FB
MVVPCYNYGHFLPDCVQGVLRQDGVDVDVLIVDDCSPDGSAAVARQLAEADPRVRVIEHSVNAGHIATYNEGLAAVDGDYVVLLSADDLVTPGSFQRATALLEAHPEVGMVHGFTRTFTDQPPPARTEVKSWTLWPGAEWIARVCRSGGNPVATPEVMLRNDTMRKLGGYDKRAPHAGDFLMWLRAAALGGIGRLNGVDQAYYRVHGKNMHTQQFAGADTDLRGRYQAFEIFFDEDAGGVPDAGALRTAAALAVAREALAIACSLYEAGPSSDDKALAARLVALAEEIYPPAASSRLRQRYGRLAQREAEGKGPLVPRRVSAFNKRVRHHVAWRRWRRSGVESTVKLP